MNRPACATFLERRREGASITKFNTDWKVGPRGAAVRLRRGRAQRAAHVRSYIKDPAALAARMREWAQIPDLTRIIVSQVDPIVERPAETLLRLADNLDD